MLRLLLLLIVLLPALAAARPYDPHPELLEAGSAGERAQDVFRRGYDLFRAGKRAEALAEIASSQTIALQAVARLRHNQTSMLAADRFSRRVSAGMERLLYGDILLAQLFINKLLPDGEITGTDLAFTAAVAGHGTLFAESLERRLAAEDQPQLQSRVGPFEALSELDAAVALAQDQAAQTLRDRFAPLRASLLQQLGLPPGQPGLNSWWREPTSIERQIAALMAARPFRSADVAADLGAHGIAARLPFGSLLLTYYCGLKTCFLFALHPSGQVRFMLLPIEREPLAHDLNFAKLQLSLATLPDPDPLRSISDGLLGGVGDWLASSSDLFVLPDGPIFAFPFAALLLPGTDQPLVSRLSVTVIAGAPYAPKIPPPRKVPGPPLVLGIGEFTSEKPLETAKSEARNVAALLQTKALTGNDVTRAIFRKLAADAPIIHIASHAKPDGQAVMASSLLLKDARGRDDPVTAVEILSLSLRAKLVVLSACETGYPTETGESLFSDFPANNDPLGLVRAFLLTGAQAVIATHWSVDDTSTSTLMARFYRAAATGVAFAEALRSAQDSLRQEGARPGLWAPFFLTVAGL